MRIDVLMPTYNCAPFIDRCLESVTNQRGDIRIIARDDASSDSSLDKLNAWKLRLGDRLRLLPSSKNLGMIRNYDAVLGESSAPYVMMCDPDDIWLPERVEKSMRAMQLAEKQYGQGTPIMVCGDAEVIDSAGAMISRSYWNWFRQNPANVSDFRRMIVDNPCLTSTITMNRALVSSMPSLQCGAACPDWWPALFACAFGKIVVLNEPLIRYRRHSGNDSHDPLSRTGNYQVSKARLTGLIDLFSLQAANFVSCFASQLHERDRKALWAAERLPEMNWIARRLAIIRHGLWFGSPIKNVGLMLLV